MDTPIYQYHVFTYGGFYNDEYKRIHGLDGGDFLFDSYDKREKFIDSLRLIEKNLNAKYLCLVFTEGFCCNIRTILHRVIEFDNKQYYSCCDMGINCEFSAAKYHLEEKWYPGFNDYPFGKDFDYNQKELKIVKEWITGAFQDFDECL